MRIYSNIRKFLTNIFEIHTLQKSRSHSDKILKQNLKLRKGPNIFHHIAFEIKLASLAIVENDLLNVLLLTRILWYLNIRAKNIRIFVFVQLQYYEYIRIRIRFRIWTRIYSYSYSCYKEHSEYIRIRIRSKKKYSLRSG